MAACREEPASAVMLSGGQREPPGPGGWDPPGPGAPGRFFCKIGSCLNFLCCCWFLKDCFGGPLSPPGPPGRPDPALEARAGTEAVPPYRVSERPACPAPVATAQECYPTCDSPPRGFRKF
ncbi:uncharacterized protein LOC133883031 [Alnus glutinosa]|uniref:uncharacterized protein LOC133883031 n=1 Tax=Alnus glutinosa TaxID=3517 RepID=UPI002D79EE5E|nr:uncharacterized protein LOC133883031 [Alnus glutinosa]